MDNLAGFLKAALRFILWLGKKGVEMKQLETVGIGIAGMVVIIVLGCATGVKTSSTVTPRPPRTEVPAEPVEFQLPSKLPLVAEPGEVSEPVPGGVIDWSGNTVRARGTGFIDPGAKNKAQAKLMAERAATVVAQRNLLEIVKWVRVNSETRVEDFMTDYDVINTDVEGTVKGARQVGPAKYDSVAGIVTVELEINLYAKDGLADALSPALGGKVVASSVSPRVKEFFQEYSGLVIDGGETGLKPALFPKIYDEDGNLLLDTKNYAGYLTGQTTLQFISDLDKLLARPELATNPLVLEVKQVRGKLGTDIVLGPKDARQLKWLKDGFKYLLDAGRILVRVRL
ncbi:hypothetical protein CH330_05180 [candidate division WOR-3 bacterium JGI_Cruoil_03_51_56]|uniref:LPP20 lipoprotein n=1 Tax=candidate division WOR-3 bacterium JGI_Cruoil_03_51_56 TaxID=1973747 RepID=A0A235BV38_UNCW3|nr:MAG: hypothetical protein CH330_05180 [candidate division WOR-3 bacterium JGI_Cruoil_03_51_56]